MWSMDDWEKAVHGLEEALEKYRETLVQATVLDRDNQPIATGTATPVTEGVHGAFWPQNPETNREASDTLASRAAVLRRSDGTASKFVRFERCPQSKYSPHFHFETET